MSKGEDTRMAILEQAAAVFNRKGYHGTSLSDLMRSTGLEKGGIYNHFAGKTELALASFDHVVGKIRRALAESVRGERNSVARLERMIGVFGRIARGFPVPGGCPVMNTAIEADHANPELRAAACGVMDEWQRFVRSIVESGIERGELLPDTDPERFTRFLIGSIEGAVMLGSLYDDPSIVDAAATNLIAYIRLRATER